jgi:hypothetical protein
VQGYNAHAVATADGIVLATSVSNSPSDSTAFVGLMRAACVAAEQMGAGPVGTVLADAGYLTVDNLTAAGPDRLIVVGKWRDLEQAARNDAPSQNDGQSRSEIEIMRDSRRRTDSPPTGSAAAPSLRPSPTGHQRIDLRALRAPDAEPAPNHQRLHSSAWPLPTKTQVRF